MSNKPMYDLRRLALRLCWCQHDSFHSVSNKARGTDAELLTPMNKFVRAVCYGQDTGLNSDGSSGKHGFPRKLQWRLKGRFPSSSLL